jgi:hypothetical protein
VSRTVRRWWPRVVAVTGVGLVAAGCLPTAVTDQGRVVNDLWTVFLVPAVIVAAIVKAPIRRLVILFFHFYLRRLDDSSQLWHALSRRGAPGNIGQKQFLKIKWEADSAPTHCSYV